MKLPHPDRWASFWVSGLFLFPTPLVVSPALAGEWPGFRGDGSSTIDSANLPVSWSEEEGISWRSPLTGFGQSSPVIWGNQIFVTSVSGEEKETLHLESFDLATGAQRWVKEHPATQRASEVTDMISQGAPTPVVSADGVFAFFESGDLIAWSLEGEKLWSRSLVEEFGEFQGGHGVGSSLVSTPQGLALLVDHDGPSYLLLVDPANGETIWKNEREPRVSWTTPLYLEYEGTAQLIVSSNKELASYRLDDGEKIWWVDGIEGNNVPSPSSDGERVYIGSSTPGQCLAVRLGGSGDVTESHIVWKAAGVTSSFGSPLIAGGNVFYVNRAGALQAVSISNGEEVWQRRLPESTWATPLATPNRLYFFSKDGSTVVHPIEGLSEDSDPLAENQLMVDEGDRVYGYAVSPDRIFVRTYSELVAIGD